MKFLAAFGRVAASVISPFNTSNQRFPSTYRVPVPCGRLSTLSELCHGPVKWDLFVGSHFTGEQTEPQRCVIQPDPA